MSLTILTYYERFLVVVGGGESVCRGVTTPIVMSTIATNLLHCGYNVLVIHLEQRFSVHTKPTTFLLLGRQINILIVFLIRATNYRSLSPQLLVVIL